MKRKNRKTTKPVEEIHKILDMSEATVRSIAPVAEFETNNIRSHICGGWFNHEIKMEVYIFHRCDFFEVRISKYGDNGVEARLGCYILLAINNGFDTHVCKFHDGKKEVIIGYNAYRDEIVLSPSGITFERSTIKDWDWFAETMRHDPNFKADSFDQEDQIFKKGFVSLDDNEELNTAFKELLGHNGSTPPATEI